MQSLGEGCAFCSRMVDPAATVTQNMRWTICKGGGREKGVWHGAVQAHSVAEDGTGKWGLSVGMLRKEQSLESEECSGDCGMPSSHLATLHQLHQLQPLDCPWL